MEKQNWNLQPGIQMDPKVAEDVARMACALKSLHVYASMLIEEENCPEDLRTTVQDGLDAMARVFQW
jgi:hypothetical protein